MPSSPEVLDTYIDLANALNHDQDKRMIEVDVYCNAPINAYENSNAYKYYDFIFGVMHSCYIKAWFMVDGLESSLFDTPTKRLKDRAKKFERERFEGAPIPKKNVRLESIQELRT